MLELDSEPCETVSETEIDDLEELLIGHSQSQAYLENFDAEFNINFLSEE